MRRLAKLTVILLGFVFLGMQFVSTAATPKISAPTGGHMAQVIDPQVGAILDRSCQDCHSNHTNWPWYSRVAPVSWIVSKHVSEGREMLDFSEWANQPSTNERMEICDAVSGGGMPLASYTLIHRRARLSKRDVKLICDWAAAPNTPMKLPQVSKSTNSPSMKKLRRDDSLTTSDRCVSRAQLTRWEVPGCSRTIRPERLGSNSSPEQFVVQKRRAFERGTKPKTM